MAYTDSKTGNKKQDIVSKVYENLRYSYEAYKKLHRAIKDDFKFVQGEQWDAADVQLLREAGVKALTINKIKPIIKLLTGIERQSPSDQKAFPEGGEDQITADIATRLMKNIAKMSDIRMTESEQFKNGAIGGMAFIEPYMDYTYDLIHGSLQFDLLSALDAFPDPDAKKYDLSDGKFFIKVKRGLTKDEVLELFPEQEKKIENIGFGTIDWENFSVDGSHITRRESYTEESDEDGDAKDGGYDLIECYYKKLTKKYFVAVPEQGLIQEMPGREEAEQIQANLSQQGANATIITKMIPVIRKCQVIGPELMYDEVSEFYPAWKSFHFVPFFAERITEEIGNKELTIQGIVRGIKDLQEEFNKRRTQELRHLNSSANSGFIVEKNSLDTTNLEKIKKYGSSAGLVIEATGAQTAVQRITPMPLSQGHVQLAEENAQDLKEASGVNPDLLATDSKSQSGRAILLKQRQGLSMIQEMLDNLSMTKRIIGKFMLSQMKEVYTVDSAMRVLGDAWIAENFSVPVTAILSRGLAKLEGGQQPSELEERVLLTYPQAQPDQPIHQNGQLIMEVDWDTAIQVVNQVLNDTELGKYDINVGEGPYAETIRMANFLDLKELATQGMPIPPDVLIEMSLIPEGQKKSIQRSLAAQQQALIAQQQQKGQ